MIQYNRKRIPLEATGTEPTFNQSDSPRSSGIFIGTSPSGKAMDFDSIIRRFKPGCPNQYQGRIVATLYEYCVCGASPQALYARMFHKEIHGTGTGLLTRSRRYKSVWEHTPEVELRCSWGSSSIGRARARLRVGGSSPPCCPCSKWRYKLGYGKALKPVFILGLPTAGRFDSCCRHIFLNTNREQERGLNSIACGRWQSV